MPSPIRILHVIGAMNRAGAETMIMNLYRACDTDKVQFSSTTRATMMKKFVLAAEECIESLVTQSATTDPIAKHARLFSTPTTNSPSFMGI